MKTKAKAKSPDKLVDKYKLINRDQIDILEAYVGDCAHYFSWNGRILTSVNFGIADNNKELRRYAINIIVMLMDYPSTEAKVVGKFQRIANYGDPVFVSVLLTNPKGMELFNEKITAAIKVWNNVVL